jgi:hypothetical protein
MRCVAGPRVLVGGAHHVGAHRILLDISEASEPVPLVANQESAIAIVPKRPNPVIFPIEIADVSASELLHRFWQPLGVSGCHDQMKVIAHQHECVDGHSIPRCRPPEKGEERSMIAMFSKDVHPVVAALNHMDADIRYEDPTETRHVDPGEQESISSADIHFAWKTEGTGLACCIVCNMQGPNDRGFCAASRVGVGSEWGRSPSIL